MARTAKSRTHSFVSDLSGKEFPVADKVLAKSIRQSVFQFMQREHPEFTRASVISISELNQYRQKYIAQYVVGEIGELTELERTVLKTLDDHHSLTRHIERQQTKLTTAQRIADRMASFGGSWTFITAFFAFLLVWIGINSLWLVGRTFDPYPFILLNLILSCLAAIQAPIIMMSQNRQEEKDRDRSRKDYMINLKSELEIRLLHEKIDHLIINQQQELIEIQKVQIEMMNDILDRLQKR